MTTKIRPVILCGGSGTRLWPVSRQDYPKQFVEFPKANGKTTTLFSFAIQRFDNFDDQEALLPPSIIASEPYRFYVKKQIEMSSVQDAEVFLEPASRNTAASLTIAALKDQEDDPILVVMPSDQFVENTKFQAAVNAARSACENGEIVLIGIKPSYPETGYGYIQAMTSPLFDTPVSVERFVEKPTVEKAEEYLYAGGGTYLWNSGIFILKASVWIEALKRCRPDIYEATVSAWEARKSLTANEFTVSKEDFLKVPSESVDYAVLEHCKTNQIGLKVLAFDGRWTDLGSWKSVWETTIKDVDGNFTVGDVLKKDVDNSLLISTHRPIVCNKLSNIAVVETPDAILVSSLEASQDIKSLVSDLKEENFTQAQEHRKGRRPWGYYDSIDQDEGFKVKRIVVNPGCALSLQRHKQRAEHWVVVKGEACVQLGEIEYIVRENQSIYIDKYKTHRLTNRTDSRITLIEVQVGDYLGEDDIERLEDVYNRN